MIMSLKQKKTKFKPRIKLNHNIYNVENKIWNKGIFFSCHLFLFLLKMEVEEEKQHEGIQQYYITKIEALQV